ncbi:MAG TPA: phosphoribosyltransferase family protein [Phycisphaerales bacterium]|nr:phosphoribosyltransferase family protein [Phycisphaerales bacterium]
MKRTVMNCLDELEEIAAYWIGRHFPRPDIALGDEVDEPFCSWCGQTEDVLSFCTCGTRTLPWSRVIRLGSYKPPLSTCLIRGKYSRWYEVLELIGHRLGRRVRGCVPPHTVVVPMPMPYLRWWFRGINHSAVLAKYVAQSAGLQRCNPLLRKETPPQAGLSASGRTRLKINTIRSFPWANLRGKPVVLVDDVLTTGRTLEVASKALKSIGASTITVAVAAVTNYEESPKKVISASFTH